MNNYLKLIILVIIAVAAVYFIPRRAESPVLVTDFISCVDAGGVVMESFPQQCNFDGKTYTEDINENPEVVIEQPKFGEVVSSPMTVKGKARGNWFFEANLPVKLNDQTGVTLAQKGFQAVGEWMTTDYVEFEGTLEFTVPAGSDFGVLVIEKDNASGLPENDASFAVPVRFR